MLQRMMMCEENGLRSVSNDGRREGSAWKQDNSPQSGQKRRVFHAFLSHAGENVKVLASTSSNPILTELMSVILQNAANCVWMVHEDDSHVSILIVLCFLWSNCILLQTQLHQKKVWMAQGGDGGWFLPGTLLFFPEKGRHPENPGSSYM